MEFNKLLLNDLSQFGPLEMDRSGVELLTSCNLECFVIELVVLQILSFVGVQIVKLIKLPI